MAIVLPAFNPTAGIPEAIRAFRQRQIQGQQQTSLNRVGQGLGLNLQGLNPQLASQLILQAQQARSAPGQQGFTLSQGQTRFGPGGQEIASVTQQPTPQTPEQTALTRAQTQKTIKETVAIDPSTLSIDEKRKRDLIDAGINPKVVSGQEKRLRNSQIAKNRAEAERLLRESNGTLSPEKLVAQGNTLRKEFDSLSKDFRTIRDSNERLQAAVADPSAAGDLAVIFNFMKILDPGSVVRESEFATAQNAASVPTAIRNLWNKALNGERISVNRSDFANQAANLIGAQQRTQDKLVTRYTKLANRFGVRPEDVVTQTGSSTSQVGRESISTPDAPIGRTPEQESRLQELRRLKLEASQPKQAPFSPTLRLQ